MQFSMIETPNEQFVQATLHAGQTRIFASGEVHVGDTDRFLQFVRANNISNGVVYLDSPGGSLAEGLRLGQAIRNLGYDTQIGRISYTREHGGAVCASACAYIFAGGVNRFFSENDGRLGLHQFYSASGDRFDASDAQIVSGALVEYFQSMGVDAGTFARSVTATTTEMVWLSPAEAAALRLANNGSQPTQSTIRMREGIPYLRLEQVHHNVTARILILCASNGYSVLAGIVTNPDEAQSKWHGAARNYLELDWNEFLPNSNNVGLWAEGSVLWIDRDVSSDQIETIIAANEIGVWVDSVGPLRWGATLDLRDVRTDIRYFLQNCR